VERLCAENFANQVLWAPKICQISVTRSGPGTSLLTTWELQNLSNSVVPKNNMMLFFFQIHNLFKR